MRSNADIYVLVNAFDRSFQILCVYTRLKVIFWLRLDARRYNIAFAYKYFAFRGYMGDVNCEENWEKSIIFPYSLYYPNLACNVVTLPEQTPYFRNPYGVKLSNSYFYSSSDNLRNSRRHH